MTPGGNHRPNTYAWPAELTDAMEAVPPTSQIWIAFSGGLDSTLLLHLAHDYLSSGTGCLGAIHINHQLQPNAADCEAHCRAVCRSLGIPLVVETVDVWKGVNGSQRGEGGVEEAARNARYRVFEKHLQPDSVLLMAHHADDQAETILFRVLRGSGVMGLGGMPGQRPLSDGQLVRPLLAFSREQLAGWAQDAGLRWMDDPSNRDETFDRNFLRHSILAQLKQRWPTLLRRISRTAAACEEADTLTHRLADIHYVQCGGPMGRLDLTAFRQLSRLEQKNLLRWWIADRGWPVPSMRHWDTAVGELLDAGDDRKPLIQGRAFSIRRYRGALYLVAEKPSLPAGPVVLAPDTPVRWGRYTVCLTSAEGESGPPPRVEMKVRAGGEIIRATANGPSRPLKKWLQEMAVPPWEREQLPLFWDAGELVGVADLWLSPRYAKGSTESGWRIVSTREFN